MVEPMIVRNHSSSPRHGPCSTPGVPTQVHKPLVLVVEDEPEAAELVESLLLREGCEVLHARDGATALELARELPQPDLVLLDLELPVMDGRALLESLRSDPSISGIPVVVISGAPDATTIRATDNVGKAKLLDGLARILKRRRGDDEGAAPSTANASV
jgi:CheY-like chemotaxis protein